MLGSLAQSADVEANILSMHTSRRCLPSALCPRHACTLVCLPCPLCALAVPEFNVTVAQFLDKMSALRQFYTGKLHIDQPLLMEVRGLKRVC